LGFFLPDNLKNRNDISLNNRSYSPGKNSYMAKLNNTELQTRPILGDNNQLRIILICLSD